MATPARWHRTEKQEPLKSTLRQRQQGNRLQFTMKKQWTSSYKSKTITGFKPLEETSNHVHSAFFNYRRTQTIKNDTKIHIIALQTKMPNDQGGCRPLMAAKLTTRPVRGKTLRSKMQRSSVTAL